MIRRHSGSTALAVAVAMFLAVHGAARGGFRHPPAPRGQRSSASEAAQPAPAAPATPSSASTTVSKSGGGDGDHDARTVVVEPGVFLDDPWLYPYASVGFGWGWGWDEPAWYGPPWYGPYPYPELPYPTGSAPVGSASGNLVPVELHVHPWTSSLIVDGNPAGEARDFDTSAHPLWLKAGVHTLELQHPGYKPLQFNLDLDKGQPFCELHYRLERDRA